MSSEQKPQPARFWSSVSRKVSRTGDAPGRPEWVGTKLAKVVQLVCSFLRDVTAQQALGQDAAGRDVVRLAAMPKTAFAHTHGLAFVHRTKRGFLVSITREQVVLIGKSVQADGSIVWSAPVFLKGRAWGLGLTAGCMTQRMCLAIMNDKGMAGVLKPHHNLGLSASFLIDMDGSRLRRMNASSSGAPSQVLTDADGGMMAQYYLLDAAMVDLSFRGGYFGPDVAMNEAIYGEAGLDAGAVLGCRVQPPPEVQPVYDLLNAYVREAKAQHPRITTMHDRSHGAGLHHMSRHSSMQGSLPAKAAEQALAAVQGSSSGAGARPAAGQGSPPREPRRAPHGGADGGSGGGGGGAQAVPATRLRRTSS